MTPERWQQINQLYQSTLELEASRRAGFINQACVGDDELRQEVESLLASHEQAKSFIETPALEVAAQVLAEKQSQSIVGQLIGSYKILALLGMGGMGEVYRAKDTRLEREVAVKILPAAFSTDVDRLRRFEQEARAAGQLNHPNVLAIYDVGAHEGSPYIVSELLEGETLRDRLRGRALPPRKAMEYGLQIVRGLAAAHEKGIVHRDLKPENLFLTQDGRIKILDFGLAKLRPKLGPGVDTAEPNLLKSDPGMVLGTVGYMSPEQVRAEDTDHRSDIFSFGAILYEMLSGRRAFQGKSAAETMSAILKEEPPELTSTNPNIPAALEHIAARCLEKGREQRFQAASDLAFDLEELLRSALPPPLATSRQRGSRERLAWAVAFILSLMVLFLVFLQLHRAPAEKGVTRFIVAPPQNGAFSPKTEVAVSPDGGTLAFTAVSQGTTLLWVRPLESLAARVLPGTDGAIAPFWSPDSRSVGFVAQGKLKRVEVSSGLVVILCNVDGDFAGGTWNRDGVILFSLSIWSYDVLYRVSSSGGPAAPVTTFDPAHSEWAHWSPQFLPDGRHFLYRASVGSWEVNTKVGSLDAKENKIVLNAEAYLAYAEPGYLLFLRDGSLLAQPFDNRRLEVTGQPIPVPEPIHNTRDFRTLLLSVSENGLLTYEGTNRDSQLVWFDRGGKQLESIGEPREYVHLELSPDDKSVVVEIPGLLKGADIWQFDLLDGIFKPSTFDPGFECQPIWSADGSHIVYTSNQGEGPQIQQKMSDGTGKAEVFIQADATVSDCSRDGRFIAYELGDPKGKIDLWVLPLFGDRKPFPFLQTEFNEFSGRFSPNGRWIAYCSDESGKGEVYVQSFPASGAKWQISTHGGLNPRWRHDGKELFYLASDQKLMAVAVDGESAFRAGVPKALFQTREIWSRYRYAVTADGQRFLVNTPLEEASTSPITVVLNWTAELKRRSRPQP